MKNLKPLTDFQLQTLSSKGYVVINVPQSVVHAIDDAKNSFLDFCISKDIHEKQKWSTDLLSATQKGEDPDENYIYRGDEKHDKKEIFHFRRNSFKQLARLQLLSGTLDREMLWSMETGLNFGSIIGENILAQLSQYFEDRLGYNFYEKFYRKNNKSDLLRFLLYHLKGEYYARPHIDRAALTIAFPDNSEDGKPCPGLFLEGMEKPYQHQPLQAIVFLGLKTMIMTDPTIQDNLSCISDTWTGEHALAQAPIHWADRMNRLVRRITAIHFTHTNIPLSEKIISAGQQRVTRERLAML